MLIKQKMPQGSIYPQLTQAPITSYADFLNHFRGGHTIDDNLSSPAIQSTDQYAMFKTALTSGHLVKQGSPIYGQGDFVVDIFLTEKGEAAIPREDEDRKFCLMAVELAKRSIPEDKEPHPFVGAVIVKNGHVIATGFRGETGKGGDHAEFCAIKTLAPENPDRVDLSGCTLYTTLEPCSNRKSKNKTACATRLINAKVERVVFGLADKDETVYGHVSLSEAGIDVDLFPKDLVQELQALNKTWSETRRNLEVAPPPNDTGPIWQCSYYKPGTPMTDNIHLLVRPPKGDGFYTVEDGNRKVLAWAKTIDEVAIKWHSIDKQKVIVEKLQRQSYGGSSRLFSF